MSELIGWVNIVTTDKDIGNEFASRFLPEFGKKTFGAMPLREPGSDVVSAWGASLPVDEKGLTALDELSKGSGVDSLKSIGVKNSDDVRKVVTFEHGKREEVEGNLGALIASLGYVYAEKPTLF